MTRMIAGPGASHDYSGIPANMNIKTFHGLQVTNYDEAMRAMGIISSHRRNPPRYNTDYKLASNIYLRSVWTPGHFLRICIAVVLYDYEIVRYYNNNTFSVSNMGFNTPTTATRINQFTPSHFRVWHHNKQLCCGKKNSIDHSDRWS